MLFHSLFLCQTLYIERVILFAVNMRNAAMIGRRARIEYDIQRDLVCAQIELILDNEPLWRGETSLVASLGFSRYRRCSRLTARLVT